MRKTLNIDAQKSNSASSVNCTQQLVFTLRGRSALLYSRKGRDLTLFGAAFSEQEASLAAHREAVQRLLQRNTMREVSDVSSSVPRRKCWHPTFLQNHCNVGFICLMHIGICTIHVQKPGHPFSSAYPAWYGISKWWSLYTLLLHIFCFSTPFNLNIGHEFSYILETK